MPTGTGRERAWAGGAAAVTFGAGGGNNGVATVAVAAAGLLVVTAHGLVVIIAKAKLLLHLPRAGSALLQRVCRGGSGGASLDRPVTSLALGASQRAQPAHALRTLHQAGALPAARETCAARCKQSRYTLVST